MGGALSTDRRGPVTIVSFEMNQTELLAIWYLRFNGYFTAASFTTHPNLKKGPGSSDADVLAVRFQHSDERQARFIFQRDARLIRPVPIDIILAEVKSSECALNRNWIKREFANVDYALRWVGRWSDQLAIEKIAKDVYEHGEWHDAATGESVRYVCFGRTAT